MYLPYSLRFDFQYDQLCGKGNFSREDIVTVLTANQGNVDAAFQELNKVQLKPFLMRIWGQGDSNEVTSGQTQTSTTSGAAGDDPNLGEIFSHIFVNSRCQPQESEGKYPEY